MKVKNLFELQQYITKMTHNNIKDANDGDYHQCHQWQFQFAVLMYANKCALFLTTKNNKYSLLRKDALQIGEPDFQ